MPEVNAADVALWCGAEWLGAPSPIFYAVRSDSRTIQAGDLFVALRGPRYDGHDYVAEAFARGAAGAVVKHERADEVANLGPVLPVADTLAALWNLARGYRATLRADIIGVTGSTGKTTVKEMVSSVLAQQAVTAKTHGNWNNDIGLPLSLLEASATSRFGVFELGMNHPGELAPLCQLLRPRIGIITNIGPVHMEFFPTLEAIAQEKAELLRCLPANGVAVLDVRSEFYPFLRSQTSAPVVTIGSSQDCSADYCAEVVSAANGEFRARESASGEEVFVHLSVPGEHMITNAMFAVAVGRTLGLEWPKIVAGLEQFRPPPLRWNVTKIQGILFINDAYNANPMSMRAALAAFAQQPVSGMRWLVLGDMLELGACALKEHEELGRWIATRMRAGMIVLGDLGARIADGAEQRGMDKNWIWRCREHAGIVDILKKQLNPGDAVLLKGSRGMALEKVLEYWRDEIAEPQELRDQ